MANNLSSPQPTTDQTNPNLVAPPASPPAPPANNSPTPSPDVASPGQLGNLGLPPTPIGPSPVNQPTVSPSSTSPAPSTPLPSSGVPSSTAGFQSPPSSQPPIEPPTNQSPGGWQSPIPGFNAPTNYPSMTGAPELTVGEPKSRSKWLIWVVLAIAAILLGVIVALLLI